MRHRASASVRDRQLGPIGRSDSRRRNILRWVYLARIGLAGGLFAGAVLAWSEASPSQTLATSLASVLTLTLTPGSYWFSHVSKRPIGANFIYAQAIFDVLLLSLVVHLTGGRESVVAPFYILLISAYALMLPLGGGLLVAALACMAYIADVFWGHGTAIDTVLTLQLVIFAIVALVVGLITTKLTQAGVELTTVEHALEQLRLDTGDILSNIPTAVLTVDGNGRLAYVNPAAERLLAIKAKEWLDQPVMDELGRRSGDLQKALERTRSYRIPVGSLEIELSRNGESVPVGVSTAVLDRLDGPPSVTAIMRDISDVKRVERLRQRTERLEAVAELSASLAHEIKNPLASISSSVQQLKLTEGADDDDKLLSALILKESDRLSRLLSDFIDFARVRVERASRVDLRDVVNHAIDVVQQNPSYRSEIEILRKFDRGPVTLNGDEDLLYRIAANLILNAVQAAIPGRRTVVAVQVSNKSEECLPFKVDIHSPVLLRVSDDGPGIQEEDLNRIFDPFFSRRRGGSGLGLAIVHRAVQEHNGTVTVTSKVGEGTDFIVCLPGVAVS